MSDPEDPFVALVPPFPQPIDYPDAHDMPAWRAFWAEHGQPWRREPQILFEQMSTLARLMAKPAPLGPFSGWTLTRADVEWLLATLEGRRGPIDWSDPAQRTRTGLDLRGVRLSEADLSELPLAGLVAGFTHEDWRELGGGDPFMPNLIVDRNRTNLRGANLSGAHLEGAILNYAFLSGVNFEGAWLDDATLRYARLDADPDNVDGSQLPASLVRVSARGAAFTGSWLRGVRCEDADFLDADLRGARLEGASLKRARLIGTDLREARLDEFTDIGSAVLGDGKSFVALAGAKLVGVDLSSVPWTSVTMLGDELIARERTTPEGKHKSRKERLFEFSAAARTYRQLSQMLRRQGFDGPAGEFSFRAQNVQRDVTLRRILQQGQITLVGAYLFSSLLAVLTGYGYRLGRIIRAYVLLVGAFACAYYLLGLVYGPHLEWYEALFVSLTSFHGRVFAEVFKPGSPQIWVTAGEAICGLLVESVFIAMLTRRFFGS